MFHAGFEPLRKVADPGRTDRVKPGKAPSRTRQTEVRSGPTGRILDAYARGAGAAFHTGGPVHNDITFIALTIVFFVACGLLTIACDRIIGPDPVEDELGDDLTEAAEEVAA
jgi:hypothetical protein